MPAPKNNKAISLYEINGFGHLKPALSFIEQMKHYPVDTEAWDIYADESGETLLDRDSFYNRISTNPSTVKIWNYLTNGDAFTKYFRKPYHWLDAYPLKHLATRIKNAHQQNPNTIFFSTHFTPANIAARTLPHQKVFVYVTDIHPHPVWAVKKKNLHYLVPLDYTKYSLVQYGIDPDNIHIASFPIHPQLIKGQTTRHKNRIKNLSSEKTTDILIISGGAGTGQIQMQNLLKTFAAPAHAHQINIKFLASTRKLRDALKDTHVKQGLPVNSVEIDVYKPDILYKSMRWAEVLITKAGGDITFEALAEGLPVYTLKDVGDHERINREYLQKAGVSRQLESSVYPWELIHHDLLTGRLKKMAQASNKLGKFHRDSNLHDVLWEQMGW